MGGCGCCAFACFSGSYYFYLMAKKLTPLQKVSAQKVTTKKQYFMQRGKVWKKASAIMSNDLAESVVRTWERVTDWKK